MTIDDIEHLLRRLDGTDIASFEIEDRTSRLSLRFASAEARPMPPRQAETAGPPPTLKTTSFGRLRLRHRDSASGETVAYPRTVRAGDIVAFIETGALLQPVVAGGDGTIGHPLEQDGALVGYGTPLFSLL